MYLKDLTIVLTPHNRPIHLNRILDYYSDTDVEIIVADSSAQKYNLDLYDSKYIFTPNMPYAEKIHKALGYVKTKYVMLHAEDDFYNPSAISRCVDFLNSHNEYSSCQGMFTAFDQIGDKINSRLVYYNSFGRDINENSILARIESLFSSYFQFFYSVQRTEHLKEIFAYANGKVTNLFGIEILIALFGLSNGKHKILNSFFGAREIIPDSAGRSKENFEKYFYSKNNQEQVDEWLNYLSNKASTENEVDAKLVKNGIVSTLKNYIEKSSVNKVRKYSLRRRFFKERINLKFAKENQNFQVDWEKIKSFITKYPIK